MYEKVIKNYVEKITTSDIEKFGKTYGIHLDNNELKTLSAIIKKDWKTIIYGNPSGILNNLKEKFDRDKYQQIELLYTKFKAKYKNYL